MTPPRTVTGERQIDSDRLIGSARQQRVYLN